MQEIKFHIAFNIVSFYEHAFGQHFNSDLQIFCALSGSMGMISAGLFVATSGCILPQLEAENDDLQFTGDQGSWFGNNYHELRIYEILQISF